MIKSSMHSESRLHDDLVLALKEVALLMMFTEFVITTKTKIKIKVSFMVERNCKHT